MDPDLVDDAVYLATGLQPSRDGVSPATPHPKAVAKFRGQLRRFLEDLPGGVTIHELREAMEPSASDEDA